MQFLAGDFFLESAFLSRYTYVRTTTGPGRWYNPFGWKGLRYVNTYFELAASLAGASPQRWCRTLHKQDDITASKPSLQRFATSHVPIARWRKCRLDSPAPFLQETLVVFLDVVKCVRTISRLDSDEWPLDHDFVSFFFTLDLCSPFYTFYPSLNNGPEGMGGSSGGGGGGVQRPRPVV